MLRLGITFLPGAQVLRCVFPIPLISWASHAIIDANTNEYLPCMKIFVYVELTILQYVTFAVTNRCFSSSMCQSFYHIGSRFLRLLTGCWSMNTIDAEPREASSGYLKLIYYLYDIKLQVKVFILFIQNFSPQILHWDVNWDTKQNHRAQRTAQAISGLLLCADLCENSVTSNWIVVN